MIRHLTYSETFGYLDKKTKLLSIFTGHFKELSVKHNCLHLNRQCLSTLPKGAAVKPCDS